jgi:hypothetical protein
MGALGMTAPGTAHATTEAFLNQEIRNRGNGSSELEGRAARVAARDLGDERVSNGEMGPAGIPAFLLSLLNKIPR